MRVQIKLLLLLLAHPGLAKPCPNVTKSNCECSSDSSDDWEIRCNSKSNGTYSIRTSIYLDKKNVNVNCVDVTAGLYEESMFDHLHLKRFSDLELNDCPLPQIGLAAILGPRTRDVLREVNFNTNSLQSESRNSNLIGRELFEGVDGLLLLKLTGYDLGTLPGDLFRASPQFKNIDLSNNNLRELDADTFRKMVNLTVLNLQGNLLVRLPDTIFADLDTLETLFLNDNPLVNFQDDIFVGMTTLSFLNLNKVQLDKLQTRLLSSNLNLTTLFVGGTNLDTIEEGFFHKGLTKLNEVIVNSNANLKRLPPNLLVNLTDIHKVDFSNCTLTVWDKDFFALAPTLQSISISANDIETLPNTIFEKNHDLNYLNLSYNKFATVSVQLFEHCYNLDRLILSNNRISWLDPRVFEKLAFLKELNLARNRLTVMNSSALTGLVRLELLNLEQNNIRRLNSTRPFGIGESLIKVLMGKNNLTTFPWLNWSSYPYLKELHFEENQIEYAELCKFYSNSTVLVHLQKNNIRVINVVDLVRSRDLQPNQAPTGQFYLEDNPIHCNCSMYDFKVFAAVTTNPPTFPDIGTLQCANSSLLNTDDNFFVCPITEQCPTNCHCYLRAADSVTVLDCRNRGLYHLPDTAPSNTSEADFSGNRLETLKGLMHARWANLTFLNVSDNLITTGDWELPVHLKRVIMTGNNMTTLPGAIVEYLNRSNVKVSLKGNPWVCDCSGFGFKTLLNQGLVEDGLNIECDQPDSLAGHTILGLKESEMCPPGGPNSMQKFAIWFPILMIVILAVVLTCVLYYYRNKQTVVAYIYVHWHWLFVMVFRENLDEDRQYHAFISYSNEDRDIVVKLMEQLEDKEPHLKLCIHERDWAPGNLITYNIVHSVLNSKRTILILSKDFLKSVWFQLEFHIAYYHMLEDKIDRLILIVVGDLPDKDELDKDLQFLLNAKTYLVWGEQWFWEKIKFALPHKKSKASGPPPTEQPPNSDLIKKIEDKIMHYSANTVRQFEVEENKLNSNKTRQVGLPYLILNRDVGNCPDVISQV